MKINTQGLAFTIGFLGAMLIAGCEKEPASTQAPPEPKRAQPAAPEATRPPAEKPAEPDQPMNGAASEPPAAPPAHPPMGEPAAGKPAAMNGNELTLDGIVMTVPAGWENVEVASDSPMAPKAIFRIPGENGGATVRITHFPNMKGPEMDEMNINRWLGQVSKADGSPMAREDAKIETKENGPIRLTIIDAKGTVKATMRENPEADSRLIAAIIDHPQGPHFIVAAGKQAVMDKAAADIRTFIESAKVAG